MHSGRSFLIPSFSPPPSSQFHNLSHYERLSCLLELKEPESNEMGAAGGAATIESLKALGVASKSARKLTERKDDSDEISLFSGALLHRHEKRATPSMSWGESQSKRQKVPLSKKSNPNSANRPNLETAVYPIFTLNSTTSIEQRETIPVSVTSVPIRTESNKTAVLVQESGKISAKKQTAVSKLKGTSSRLRDFIDDVSVHDFDELSMACVNAGETNEILNYLTIQCIQNPARTIISMSLLIADEHLTSNLDVSTLKHCTSASNCTGCSWGCDKVSRVLKAAGALLGAVVVLTDTTTERDECFFLPLMNCVADIGATAPAALPLLCNTTLEQRWLAMRILLESDSIKIIYNYQIFLLPLVFRSLFPKQSGDSTVAISGRKIRNVFDPRLAAYMCGTDDSSTSIELHDIVQTYGETSHPSERSRLGQFEEMSAHVMGKISRKFNVQIALLKKLKAASERLRDALRSAHCWNVYNELEIPLVVVLVEMEVRGVQVSLDSMASTAELVKTLMNGLQSSVTGATGRAINLLSPDQVASLLYDELQLPRPANTPRNRHASTSEKELSKLVGLHPAVNMILQYRTLAKILGTYIDGLRPFIIDNWRYCRAVEGIHACWNQTVVSTGRLSCSRPNLQSIPKDSFNITVKYDLSYSISPREFIAARSGCVLLSVDYSQIEMRVMAHISGDLSLCELFNSSGDVYVLLASRIFNKPLEGISKVEREQAKVICLGVIYGMGAKVASDRLKLDVNAVYSITNAFFSKFSGLKTWMARVKRDVARDGYASTLFGRRRYLHEINSPDTAAKARAERQAVNTVIQGSASDLIKHAMIGIEDSLCRKYSNIEGGDTIAAERMRPRVLMQIHDELIYEVPLLREVGQFIPQDFCYNEMLNQFCIFLENYMTKTMVDEIGFRVPLKVNISVGYTWGSMSNLQVSNPDASLAHYKPNSTNVSTGTAGIVAVGENRSIPPLLDYETHSGDVCSPFCNRDIVGGIDVGSNAAASSFLTSVSLSSAFHERVDTVGAAAVIGMNAVTLPLSSTGKRNVD